VLSVHASGPASPTGTLGAIYSAASTTFRIWSPDSSNVSVTIGGVSYPMGPTTLTGYTDVYQTVVAGNLKDQSYQFYVANNAVRDPYALMVNPGTTQGVVVDMASILPSAGSWAPTPALTNREDSVIYELDVRDFTIDASSGVDPAKRGKYLGLVQTGTSYDGVKTGIDHLKDMGVTTVQILPTFDFSDTEPNWGYDPLNFNVPEEQYSQFTAPEDRIREFKDMVDDFHRNGIRVVLDEVFNHTSDKTVLGPITQKYYTTQDYSGCCGNSLDDSNPMVSRMIRDSLEQWVRDYNIDGFRFDLMGIFHHSDVESWGNYLNATFPSRNLLLYGEPWMGGGSPPVESDFVRYGTTASMQDGHVGVFNGAYRDALKGGTDDTSLGYLGGAGASSVAIGMRGSPLVTKGTGILSNMWDPQFTYDPEQTINYVSVHDNLDLADKLTYSGVGGGAGGAEGQLDKFAVGMVLTSQGIPLIAEGDEFLRSKVVNGDYTTANNSYNAGDNVNAIHWGDEVTNASVQSYYKAAIALRKSTASLRLTSWDAIHNQMSTQVSGSVIVSDISSNASAPTSYDTVVVFNPGTSTYNVSLPSGTWTKVLDASGAVNTTGTACGPQSVTVYRKS
jgi:pullulanase